MERQAGTALVFGRGLGADGGDGVAEVASHGHADGTRDAVRPITDAEAWDALHDSGTLPSSALVFVGRAGDVVAVDVADLMACLTSSARWSLEAARAADGVEWAAHEARRSMAPGCAEALRQMARRAHDAANTSHARALMAMDTFRAMDDAAPEEDESARASFPVAGSVGPDGLITWAGGARPDCMAGTDTAEV